MKYFIFCLLFLLNCAEPKTFADDIVLINNSKIEMKFQDFNEGVSEVGTSLIYVGKERDSILIKYYMSLFPPPPPPPNFYSKTKEEKKDSIKFNEIRRKYFLGEFSRIQFSDNTIKFDSLSSSKLKIVVKASDTIPRFAIDSAGNIKSYKSFPVFIKNISGKNLILYENTSLGTFALNHKDKWQLVWNNNAFVCGDSSFNRLFWVLKPEELMIFSVNYFKGKAKAKFKIGLSADLLSEEFEGNINPNLFQKQRILYEVQ